LAAESAVALAQVPLDAAAEAEELAAEFAEAPDAQSAAVPDAGPAAAAEQRALEVAEAQPDVAAVAEEPRDVVAEEAAAEVQHAAEVVEAEPRVAAAVAAVSVQPSAAAHLDLRPARSRMTKVTQTFQHARQVAKPEALRSLSSSEVSTEGVSWRPVCLK